MVQSTTPGLKRSQALHLARFDKSTTLGLDTTRADKVQCPTCSYPPLCSTVADCNTAFQEARAKRAICEIPRGEKADLFILK